MKKLLIASTALVATAGMAAAEVSLSGYAEMGIADFGGATGVEFFNDIDVTFNLSGETDNGLTFGATIDLDEVTNTGDDNGIPNAANDSSVWIRGAFGNLTLGETDGAQDWANQEIGMLTSLADDHTTHAGYWGGNSMDGDNDGQILRYDNTFGDFGVAVSYEMDDTAASNDTVQVGLKYTADLGGTSLGLGLGYADNDTTNVLSLSAKTSFSGVDVVLNYAEDDAGGDYTGIGLGYTMGDLAMTANYGEYSAGGALSGADVDGFGLAVNYSLGGGATVMAGYGDSSTGVDQFSLGLGLSF